MYGLGYEYFEYLRSTHTTATALRLTKIDSSAELLWQPQKGFSDSDVKKFIFRDMTPYQMKMMIIGIIFNITLLTN
jgi:hypothetical protein